MDASRLSLTLAGLGAVVFLSPASASEFRPMGPRALSMGGAAVACPAPAYAAYYNPAALGLEPKKGALDICFGLGVRDTGLAEHLDVLVDYDWDSAIDNPTGPEAAAIIAELDKIKPTDGLMVAPMGALGLRVGDFGSGIFPSALVSVYGSIDTTHVNATEPWRDPNSFAYNTSSLFVKGLGLAEVPIAYGHAFRVGKGGTLSVGGAMKYIQGATYDVTQGIDVTADADAIRDKLENADKTSGSFGVDAGVLYMPSGNRLSLGLLARNINSPEFETVTGAKFAEDAQVRAGAAYSLTESVLVASDIDVTANKTLIDGYKSRQLSAGIAWQMSSVSLRAGVMKNIEGEGTPVMWSAGLTIGGESFHLDITGSIAGSWQSYDEYDFPEEGGFAIALGGGW